MSAEAMSWPLRQKVGHPTRKLILYVLAVDGGDPSGTGWARFDWLTLAQRCEINVEELALHVDVLGKMGLFQRGRPEDLGLEPPGDEGTLYYRLIEPEV